MPTSGERSKYAVSLAELESSAHVPLEQQVAEQVATHAEPAISEYDNQVARLLSIQHAG
ncbi:hypothetical protein LWF15_27565 [Kineosporia rhizophila]|uniref:hypothetical protein n=1 Tax=Kineosporia TaxID=49184 RepID=UPI001E46BAE5|nr:MULTISPECIES: hypothetical protein [Kineosporia]MCE0539263.1 hypothetical protein [Kineosporia rhizophila]GLY14465.1 hypothetical protein Kisp01_14800 [Kineosporia sp. NBRC 101677]